MVTRQGRIGTADLPSSHRPCAHPTRHRDKLSWRRPVASFQREHLGVTGIYQAQMCEKKGNRRALPNVKSLAGAGHYAVRVDYTRRPRLNMPAHSADRRSRVWRKIPCRIVFPSRSAPPVHTYATYVPVLWSGYMRTHAMASRTEA
jgi:hypothetical protein